MINPVGFDPVQSTFTVRIDGEEVSQLGNLLNYRGELLETEWDAIVSTAARVLSNCPKPSELDRKVTGLALGKVQSGKTLSYTALIALALDNAYRVIIVLAGTKNPLLLQTSERLNNDLNLPRPNLTPFRNPTIQDSDVVRSILHSNGNVLLIVLKNRRRIDDISELIKSPELRHYPVLIIDDEGDEASLNNQFRRGRRSPIYQSILNLRNSLPIHAYIAYTATPQANLLISGLDILSPDFAELIEPGEGYCGGTVFFGGESNSYIRALSLGPNPNNVASKVTEELKNAIATFFVGGAIRWLRNDGKPHSMLLHTSNLQADHVQLYQSVSQLLSLWKQISDLPESDPSSMALHDLMYRAYSDLCTTVKEPPSWELVWNRLKRDEIWQTEIWMVNSLPIGRDPMATQFRLKNNILIGGNMLGRGVTVKGLAVTYITREAQNDTNADTLEQRARWFGYKRGYLDTCRIFLTNTLKERYTELLAHEDDFWETLRRNQRQGIPVRDWPRMFRLDMNTWQLRPTRPQVASFRQFTGQGWDIQRKVIVDKIIAAKNIQAIREFIKKNPGNKHRFGNVEHLQILNVKTVAIISDLLAKINVEGTDWEKSYIVEYLTRLGFSKKLDCIDILIMNNGDFRSRSMDQNGTINPMQGRSPNKEANHPDYYPGDEALHNDRVQLQIHFIRTHINGNPQTIETTALALYIPNNSQYDLQAIVRSGI